MGRKHGVFFISSEEVDIFTKKNKNERTDTIIFSLYVRLARI
ncbi:hypothetical protein [Planococcus versutus]|nr:hypothetical protein [Planococcus versutus]